MGVCFLSITKVVVLVCVMPYSELPFLMAIPNATTEWFFLGLDKGLEYMGALPSIAKSDNMKQWVSKSDLLILDDFGLRPLSPDSRIALLQMLEDRCERKSVIIVSQLPIKNCMDRLIDKKYTRRPKMTAYVYCDLFICFLWSYDQGCCGRTFKGSMHVRP